MRFRAPHHHPPPALGGVIHTCYSVFGDDMEKIADEVKMPVSIQAFLRDVGFVSAGRLYYAVENESGIPTDLIDPSGAETLPAALDSFEVGVVFLRDADSGIAQIPPPGRHT